MAHPAWDSLRTSEVRNSILIIDDDDEVASAILDLLEAEGHQVARCEDASEALERLKSGAVPDLILLDLMMPSMDGWEFRARQLADARLSPVPVLVLTGDTSSKARTIDAAGYLRKPLDYPALLATVSYLLQMRRKDVAETLSLERERLSSLGALSSSIAHEINNPLQFVTGNLELARQRLVPANQQSGAVAPLEQIDRLLAQAQRGATRIADVVRSMAAFSQPDTPQSLPLDVQEALDACILLLGNDFRHRATLERDYRPVPAVTGHPARFGQALLNLLVNALHAVGSEAPHRHVIRVATDTGPHGEAVIAVSDTGSGMTPRMAAGIFDLFYTARNLNSAQARGLAVSHRIISDMGGSISVESEPHCGAVFRVVLPPHAEPLDGGAFVPVARAAAPQRPRLMVVDDEPLICEIVRGFLEEDYRVEVFTNPREALRRLSSGEHFDLVLCDLMMPGLTGMDLHDELARAQPSQAERMVFMTGGTFTERSRRFFHQLKSPALTKPFRRDELLAALARRLAELAAPGRH